MKLSITVFLLFLGVFQAYAALEWDEPQKGSGCECIGYNCGCCGHVEAKSIHLDDTVCVNVSYLPKEYGAALTLTIDGHALINETVSARNPPPICADLPDLKKYASLCVDLYNLSWSNKTFSGCIALEARLIYVIKEKIDLGCFNLADKSTFYPDVHVDDETKTQWVKALHMLRDGKRKMMEKLGGKFHLGKK